MRGSTIYGSMKAYLVILVYSEQFKTSDNSCYEVGVDVLPEPGGGGCWH